jgi:hypothetical protein
VSSTHACDVCYRDSRDHERCPCGQEHLSPPCCLGCPCQWFEEVHPHLLVSTGPNRSGRLTAPGDLVVLSASRYAGRPGRIVREVRIEAGHNWRYGFEVALFPLGRARGRTVRVWPSSTELARIPEGAL